MIFFDDQEGTTPKQSLEEEVLATILGKAVTSEDVPGALRMAFLIDDFYQWGILTYRSDTDRQARIVGEIVELAGGRLNRVELLAILERILVKTYELREDRDRLAQQFDDITSMVGAPTIERVATEEEYLRNRERWETQMLPIWRSKLTGRFVDKYAKGINPDNEVIIPGNILLRTATLFGQLIDEPHRRLYNISS